MKGRVFWVSLRWSCYILLKSFIVKFSKFNDGLEEKEKEGGKGGGEEEASDSAKFKGTSKWP